MKILTGKLRGIALEAPSGKEKTRPTSAKVREALMSILSQDIEGSVFIDLFAGSGAVGIEALSRGAAQCVFVEKDRQALGALKKNLQTIAHHLKKQSLPLPQTTVYPLDLEKSADSLKSRIGTLGDIVWADPPYQDTRQWLQNKQQIIGQLIVFQGLFIVECEKNQLTGDEMNPSFWQLLKVRNYGQTSLVVWQKKKDLTP